MEPKDVFKILRLHFYMKLRSTFDTLSTADAVPLSRWERLR